MVDKRTLESKRSERGDEEVRGNEHSGTGLSKSLLRREGELSTVETKTIGKV